MIESFFYVQGCAEFLAELANLGLQSRLLSVVIPRYLSSAFACMLMHASLFRVQLDAVMSTFSTFSLPLHLGRQVQLNRKREKVKHLRVSVVSWCRRQV